MALEIQKPVLKWRRATAGETSFARWGDEVSVISILQGGGAILDAPGFFHDPSGENVWFTAKSSDSREPTAVCQDTPQK
jgi:hypothetical protein